MLADPWQVDIQELFEASVNEPDKIKKNLYDSLYTYILQKRQEDISNRPGSVLFPSKSLLRAFYFCFGINIINSLKIARNEK
ncbi:MULTISPECIES: hypothetical protein [Lactiplantibacillus]|uniref:hypothetical protein n=1 Tax=Lactiplantibacillus TaxID=2767842 RepID=UPI0013E90DE4|nr:MULTISPECIES: hypothetical protein [Lactiplantibacillus]